MPSQGQGKRRAGQTSENPTKRTRVSRACDQCRLAREKCDGKQPSCSTCTTAKRSCTYTASVKKRGIQPGYIRALELALAVLFQHNPENESLVNDKLSQGGASSVLLSRDSKESNKLHKRWRKTRFFADVDTLLSGGEPSRHDQAEPLSPDSDDDDSDVEAVASTDLSAGHIPGSISSTHPTATSSAGQSTRTPVAERPKHGTRHAMPAGSWKLLEAYFDYTHSWFPICEKHDVLKISYSYPTEGLELSSSLEESGAHAELWSILALASLHSSFEKESALESKNLYTITRSLIPDELGSFQLGHIKALLNLAIFNVTQSLYKAAKILVGLASRILEVCEYISPNDNPKYKHVHFGCVVLENFLSQYPGIGTSTTQNRIEQLGTIDEDGLDEWQPWAGGKTTHSKDVPRTPLLALSSFNALTKLIAIFPVITQASQDGLRLLELWQRQLPEKLSSIRQETNSPPLTPPAILLHITASCAALTLNPSRRVLLATLDVLEKGMSLLGSNCIPPIIKCLMGTLEQAIFSLEPEQSINSRLFTIRNGLENAWPKSILISDTPPRQSLLPNQTIAKSATQLPTPRSAPDPSLLLDDTQAILSPFQQSLPNLYSATTPMQLNSSVRDVPTTDQLDPGFPEMSADLDNFFDELASLDNTNNLENQPQFMQNLGFAPDANMADLFSEYIPLQSSAFMLQQDRLPSSIDPYGFYDGM